jgi:chromosome partitioning protein
MDPKILISEAAEILGMTVQGVHKQLKSKNIPYKKTRNRLHFGHNGAKVIFENFKRNCMVSAFLLVKGGVGKTTLCRETAIRATIMGKKVLVLDLDHQGNLTRSFNVDAKQTPVLIDLLENPKLDIHDSIINIIPGLDIIPSRFDNSVLDNFIMLKGIPLEKVLNKKISSLRNEYDLILIDCPPSLGQCVASAVLCADLLILPTTPCDFSDSGIDITVSHVNAMFGTYDITPIQMKIILNKYDSREKDSRETYTKLIKDAKYGDMLFNCYIRKCKDFEKYRREHLSIFETTSSNYAREDIDIFTRELLEMDSLDKSKSDLFDVEEVS